MKRWVGPLWLGGYISCNLQLLLTLEGSVEAGQELSVHGTHNERPSLASDGHVQIEPYLNVQKLLNPER